MRGGMAGELELLGWIDAGRSWPGLDRDAWLQLIAKLDTLAPMPPVQRRNPFSGEMTEFSSPSTSAVVLAAGRTVGQISWSNTGPNELLVRGDPLRVPAIAREIAARLEGSYHAVPIAGAASGRGSDR